MSDAKQAVSKLVAEIDHAELTIRLLEIGVQLARPKGQSGAEALKELRRMAARGEVPAYIVDDFECMARTAMEYIAECINQAGRVQ